MEVAPDRDHCKHLRSTPQLRYLAPIVTQRTRTLSKFVVATTSSCHFHSICTHCTQMQPACPLTRHPDLRVPPDRVTIYPSLSPWREPSPLKCFAPAMVSAGTSTYVPSMSPPHEPLPLKCYAPAMVPAGLRHIHAPQDSRTTQRSPPLRAHCRTPAGQCLATRHLRR